MLVWTALLLVNALALALFGLDKRRARRGLWRIPERTLLLVAACFGAAGALLGMKRFRHKTLHRRFALGVPIMLALQAAILLYALARDIL